MPKLVHRFIASLLVAGWCSLVVAADNEVEKPVATANDDLASRQERIASKYAQLEALMLKMAQLEAAQNPKRAALLNQAVAKSKEGNTRLQLETIAELLGKRQLARAIREQTGAEKSLEELLKLLQSEDRSERNKTEQERIKEYIKEVERMIRIQRSIQGQNEGGGDTKRISEEQAKLAERAGELSEKIKEQEEGETEPKEDSENSDKPGNDDSEKKPGEQSPKSDNESKPQSSDDNENKPGENESKPSNDSEKKPSDDSEKESSDDSTPSENKPQDGDQKPGEKNESKPQENKPGEQSPMPGQQNKPPMNGDMPPMGDSQQPQGNQDQQNQQQQQQQNPVRQQIDKAQQRMKQAEQKLKEAERKQSIEEQEKAREELEKAKAELEKILRQLREEEMERTLQALEGRFRKMLEMQVKVYEGTQKLDAIPADERTRELEVQAGRLGGDEAKIAVEAERALQLLEEEGSSVAFPTTVDLMIDDMRQIADRLNAGKVDTITQGLEEEVIASLEELLEALEQAQKKLEEQKQQQPQQPQQGGQQEQPLVDAIQELKMIKSLQLRVNKRTDRYAKLLNDENDPVGQANTRELLEALDKLGDRQRQVFDIVREIVLGRNK